MRLKRVYRHSASSKRWFRNWWKQDHFYKIRTKLLLIIRFEVDHEEIVIDWFLKDKNILRIDDTEFIVDKFGDEEDFISFEDENKKNENASYAKNAKHAKHDNFAYESFNWWRIQPEKFKVSKTSTTTLNHTFEIISQIVIHTRS
jgi:hypothetical protein